MKAENPAILNRVSKTLVNTAKIESSSKTIDSFMDELRTRIENKQKLNDINNQQTKALIESISNNNNLNSKNMFVNPFYHSNNTNNISSQAKFKSDQRMSLMNNNNNNNNNNYNNNNINMNAMNIKNEQISGSRESLIDDRNSYVEHSDFTAKIIKSSSSIANESIIGSNIPLLRIKEKYKETVSNSNSAAFFLQHLHNNKLASSSLKSIPGLFAFLASIETLYNDIND